MMHISLQRHNREAVKIYKYSASPSLVSAQVCSADAGEHRCDHADGKENTTAHRLGRCKEIRHMVWREEPSKN